MRRYNNGVLILDDKTILFGRMPFKAKACGEICFNTGMTGCQEAVSDPSYTNQIITFTFPYIGNTGYNSEDIECGKKRGASGIVVRNDITTDSNFRSEGNFIDFAKEMGVAIICGLDTRSITSKIRSKSVSNCIISYIESESDVKDLLSELLTVPSMDGMELASLASIPSAYEYSSGNTNKTIAVIDYGVKENILRILASYGVKVIVFPYNVSFEEIIKYKPDGVLLSNGPGDPRETLKITGETIKEIAKLQIPIFGICLGHQLLAGLFGAKLIKLPQGHRGINHPVIDYRTGRIEITSQNHGFACIENDLPNYINITHRSLFDGVIEGIAIDAGTKVNVFSEEFQVGEIFGVQYHPESSCGPHDSRHLFDRFIEMIL